VALFNHTFAQRSNMDGDMDGDAPSPDVIALVRVVQGEMTRLDLQGAMGLKNLAHFRKAYLTPALASGCLEMTMPDKPRSTNQRYRLTAKGQQWQKETDKQGNVGG
jgi:hypothetical protein